MMCKVQLLVCLFALGATVRAEKDALDYGQGLQMLGKVVRQFLQSQPEDIILGDGVHLVTTQNANEISGRAMSDGGSVFTALENYLRSHEIQIKLPELLPKGDLGRSLKSVMEDVKEDAEVTGRGKKGGGFGGIMVLSMMFGKMLAALGLGGVGLLAMKALMVSAMALMLSMIIGIKKLASHGGDDGGYHVIHASGGHHDRKKREAAEMAYNSWKSLYSSITN
ncbi:uncharacterized protein LOC108742905 [Agrilus planipennis]|uniref:Uncharacterized protein LOC108742905 n=1 Tax=Agrilus planipennis TaxID=224129 RepID=A0A1W4XLW2_AGRPL|nr:uncharacterized protein LOC108742905 [Agrilus planipennis]